MKTADLIAALAAEPPPPPLRLGRRVGLALVGGAAVSAALFMALLGPRPDFMAAAHTMRFDLKFVDALALLAPSALLALRLLRPDARPGALIAALIAPFVLLGGAVVVELIVVPPELWMPRLVGTNAPLAALIVAMRAGAPAHPALTGALAGAAAAGAAATIYATNCTDDSPLFVASWYPLATLIVVAAGALAGRKWLQW